MFLNIKKTLLLKANLCVEVNLLLRAEPTVVLKSICKTFLYMLSLVNDLQHSSNSCSGLLDVL